MRKETVSFQSFSRSSISYFFFFSFGGGVRRARIRCLGLRITLEIIILLFQQKNWNSLLLLSRASLLFFLCFFLRFLFFSFCPSSLRERLCK